MAEEKITLDRETFKTLASGTRVDILKSLDRRRKTLSELSKQFGMSVSTVKEHLETLVKAGLIVQDDDGHKWKYYDLTKKGKRILHPEDTRIWVLLGVSVLAMIGIGYDLIMRTASQPMMAAASGGGEFMKDAAENMVQTAPAGAPEAFAWESVVPNLPYLHIIGLIVFGLIIGLSVGYLIMSRRRASGVFM
jgi:DNA-binding transcriptional ArsR family regulator